MPYLATNLKESVHHLPLDCGETRLIWIIRHFVIPKDVSNRKEEIQLRTASGCMVSRLRTATTASVRALIDDKPGLQSMRMAMRFPEIKHDARLQSSWATPVQRKALPPPKQIDWGDGCNRSPKLDSDDAQCRFWSSWQPFECIKNQDWDLSSHEKLPEMSIGASSPWGAIPNVAICSNTVTTAASDIAIGTQAASGLNVETFIFNAPFC